MYINLTSLSFHKNITFFVGENGFGKSTLLEAIAIAFGFNPEGGSKNFSFSTSDTHSPILLGMRDVEIYSFDLETYWIRRPANPRRL